MHCEDVNLVVHIDEELSDHQIEDLEHELAFAPGITSACIHERTRHLMVVDYDPKMARSIDILSNVKQRGYHAELIGI
jgi:hypothetical protein